MSMIMTWIKALLDLAYPRFCIVCGQKLSLQEEHICTLCMAMLPRTNYHLHSENPMEEKFRGKIPIEKTAALYFYQKGNLSCNIIYQLKYRQQPEIGIFLGKTYALEILPSGFFNGIDYLMPVPLSNKRYKQRGYNQAEMIAIGIAKATHIPIAPPIMKRIYNNPTQTHKNRIERIMNTEHLFLAESAEALSYKHILLIDDVITTGSTLTACASALTNTPGIRFSVLTIGYTTDYTN